MPINSRSGIELHLIVSALDMPRLQGRAWKLHYGRGEKWYAASMGRRDDGELHRRTILAHRFVCMVHDIGQPDLVVHHRNGIGLDCTRDNLKICSRAENTVDSEPRLGITGYYGVCQTKGSFQAQVRIGGKVHYSCHKDPEEAAKHRDDVLVERLLELQYPPRVILGKLNFPERHKACLQRLARDIEENHEHEEQQRALARVARSKARKVSAEVPF